MFYDNNPQFLYYKSETNRPIPAPVEPSPAPVEPSPAPVEPSLIKVYQEISNLIQQYLEENPNIGYTTVQVTTLLGTRPIPDAKITISKPIGNDFFLSKVAFTNENGKTIPIALPTRSSELSQTPGIPVPYSSYNLSASAPGYYDVEIYDVPIFQGITSIQPIDLEPIYEMHRPPTPVFDTPPNL